MLRYYTPEGNPEDARVCTNECSWSTQKQQKKNGTHSKIQSNKPHPAHRDFDRLTSSLTSTPSSISGKLSLLTSAPNALRIFRPFRPRYARNSISGPTLTPRPTPSISFPVPYKIAAAAATAAPATASGGTMIASVPVPSARAVFAPAPSPRRRDFLACEAFREELARELDAEAEAECEDERELVGRLAVDAEGDLGFAIEDPVGPTASALGRRAGSAGACLLGEMGETSEAGVGTTSMSNERVAARTAGGGAAVAALEEPGTGTGGKGASRERMPRDPVEEKEERRGSSGSDSLYAGGSNGPGWPLLELLLRSGPGSFSLLMPMPDIMVNAVEGMGSLEANRASASAREGNVGGGTYRYISA